MRYQTVIIISALDREPYYNMKKFLFVLLLAQTYSLHTLIHNYMSFDEFREKFQKSYLPGSQEYESKKKIYEQNIKALAAKACSICGVTKFFDIEPEEFNKCRHNII